MTLEHIYYIAMFRVLDCIYDEEPTEELRQYLSDANPYIWEDRDSADPAEYDQFLKFYKSTKGNKILSVDEAYNFALKYLESYTTLATDFTKVTKEEWDALCKIVKEEEHYEA